MLDVEDIRRFETGVATILDAVDKLRALPGVTEAEGLRGVLKWHEKAKNILSSIPELPDSEPLTKFAEGVERELAVTKGQGSGQGESEKRYPRDDGILPSPYRAGFFARISGNTADGTNRWYYSFVEVEKTGAGYDNWTTQAGGRTGTARNLSEDINDAAGVQGNGVDLANLDTADYTFTIQAVPTNGLVRVWETRTGATTEYWFQYENGVDGTCD